ncbi:hypothetical protein B0H34DRAFT_796588 [Crassisporium funariophilum]|nr:hypothetical protein B0H34DRAFT_796588 [Crassisporium funariophilum]
MLTLNSRFALLAVFCSIAALSFSPSIGVGAAAIDARHLGKSPGGRHKVASDEQSTGFNLQRVLPLPAWANKNRRSVSGSGNENKQKVRSFDLSPSNPILQLANILFGRIQRSYRSHDDYSYSEDNSRRSIVIPNDHGSSYLVTHAPKSSRLRRGGHKVRVINKREDSMSGGVAGTIDIMVRRYYFERWNVA